MANIFDMTDTWNDGATTFTAIKMNVTDTASTAASLLMDLRVGGVSKFSVSKAAGVVTSDIYATYYRPPGSAGEGMRLAVGTTYINSGYYVFAVNTFEQRNGTVGQTQRLYGSYTDSSNYRRIAFAMTNAGVASLKPEGAGTGASGNVLHISGLPTSNPGPDILWNNGGTVEVGT